jgi:octanoyl-[GcvH]:protein N-octanoyltransferase
MGSNTLNVIAEGLTNDGPLNTATSRTILDAVNRGELGETLEVGIPPRVLAFGKHDTSSQGFVASVASASAHGFQPTVRIAGGRAAVFHEGTLRFGWTIPADDPAATIHARFERLADAVVKTLATFGTTGVIGEVAGEYCPGQYSVHVSGRKVMGVGQRLAKNAAYVGGVIVLDGAQQINQVLDPVYRLLGIPFDPTTTGAVSDTSPADLGDFATALTQVIAAGRETHSMSVPATIRSDAAALRDTHDPTLLA